MYMYCDLRIVCSYVLRFGVTNDDCRSAGKLCYLGDDIRRQTGGFTIRRRYKVAILAA